MNEYRHVTRCAAGVKRRAAIARAPLALAADRPATTGVATGHVTPRSGALIDPIGRRAPLRLPCQVHDRNLWFADEPGQLERAKQLCTSCPALRGCLAGAVQRAEPVGVWGGQIFDGGQIVTFKRRRGRPRKDSTAPQRHPAGSTAPALAAAEPARQRQCNPRPSRPATSTPEQTPQPEGT